MERMPEALQDWSQGEDFFRKGKGKEHKDKSNGGEKGTQDLDLIFKISHQEEADDHPCKEGKGFIEIGHRSIARFKIPREDGQGMGGETDGYDGGRYF